VLPVILAVLAAYGAAPQQEKRHHFSFADKREAYDRQEVVFAVAVSSPQSEGRYTILDEIWKPRFSVSPHYHATHCETFYVVSGEVEWTVGGESHRLKAGDAVYIPPNTVHSVRVPDGKNLHTLMIYTPGGYEEHIERGRAYSDKQLKDAKILDQLRRLNDFHPVVQK